MWIKGTEWKWIIIKNKEKKKYELNKAHMWPRNKEFFKSYAKQNPYFRFTVFIALGNKEKFLKTHLNSQSYCLRKVPGQTCEAGFRWTCFQASRSDSIHSCDLLRFPLAAPFAIFSCVWTAGSRKNYPAKEVASTTGSRGDVFVVRTSKPVENLWKNRLLWSRYGFVTHSIDRKPRDWGLARSAYSIKYVLSFTRHFVAGVQTSPISFVTRVQQRK